MADAKAPLRSPSNQPEPPGYHLELDALTKIGVVSAALAYATGILAINTYLHNLGITDFSFAKPKLILTGVLVILSFFLLALLPMSVAWGIANREQERPVSSHSKKMLSLSVFPLAALIIASGSLCFKDHPGLGQIIVWKIWGVFGGLHNCFTKGLASLVVALALYGPMCVTTLSVFAAIRLSKWTPAMDSLHLSWRVIYFTFSIAMALVFMVVYISVFALTFYPAMPQAFGGGEPYFEKLAISEKGRCELQQLGIPFLANTPNITIALPVLHESNILVAVWMKRASGSSPDVIVQIDKNLISGSMVDSQASETPQLFQSQSAVASCKRGSGGSDTTASSR